MAGMSLGIQRLAMVGGRYTPNVVEWKVIRNHFVRVRRALALNQDQIKGVPQPHISKLESNDNLGPQVETFVKAIEGMGITVSSFFLEIENQTNTDLPPSHDSVTTGSRRSSTNAEGQVGGSSQIPGAPDVDLTSVVSTLGVTAIEVVERAIDRGFDRLAARQTRSAPRRQSRRRAVRRKAS